MRIHISILFFLSSFCTISAQLISPNMITTESTSIVYAAPDEVYLKFQIQNFSETLVGARTENRAKFQKVKNFLRSSGISDEHIQTEYVRIGPCYRNQGRSQEIDYYTATQSITICINDLDKYDVLVDGLLTSGASSIGNPIFRSVDMRKYQDEARAEAIVICKQKARDLAAALNQGIGRALHITEVKNFSAVPSAYANSFSENAAVPDASGRSFSAGQLSISATVRVSFVLK